MRNKELVNMLSKHDPNAEVVLLSIDGTEPVVGIQTEKEEFERTGVGYVIYILSFANE